MNLDLVDSSIFHKGELRPYVENVENSLTEGGLVATLW